MLSLTSTPKRTSTMSRLALVRLLASLIFIRCLTASAKAVITVHGPLTVHRGYSASLLGQYGIGNTSSLECSLMFLDDAGNHCGDVWPKRANCNDHSLAYSHYGCLNQYETLNFRVITRDGANGTLQVDGFSIAVHVIATEINLQLETKPYLQDSLRHELTLHCPPNFTNRCSYSLISNHKSLSLPFRGELEGPTSQFIPCGQSPVSPLLYRPAYSNNTSDAITVQTNCIDSNDTRHYILPFDLTADSQIQLRQLPKIHLRIKELSVTPLPADLLQLDPITKEYLFLKLTFPIQSTGGLYPIYSSKKGYLDATVFMFSDLQKGEIDFVPDETSIASYISTTTQYNYYVSNIAGQTVAEGTLEVTTLPRLGLKPSLRKNTGISLYSGKSSVLNSDHLDFYPPLECLNYYLQMLIPPTAGTLSINRAPLAEGDQVLIINGNLTLTYQHNENSSRSYDMIGVGVECIKHKSFRVNIPVQIIQPPRNLCNLSIYGYPGYATPLHNIKSCIKGKVGSPLKFTTNASQYNVYYLLDEVCQVSQIQAYPYISQSSSIWSECFTKLNDKKDLLDENRLMRLWHLLSPSHLSTYYVMSLTDGSGNTIDISYNVVRLLSTPQEDFEPVSTTEKANFTHFYPSLPWLRHNRPLAIYTLDATYITSHYLYVQTLGYLQSEIVFSVTVPPQHGLICYLHQLQCEHSVSNFTQEDILTDRIYYKPITKLNVTEGDSFEFDVYYLIDTKLEGDQRFYIQSAITEDDAHGEYKQFWVPQGRSKPLLRKHLKHLIHSPPAKGYTFVVLQGPSYGYLHYPHVGDHFSWEEVTDRLVVYHHQDTAVNVCSDWLVLSVSNGIDTFTANVSVAIRQAKGRNHNVITKEHKLEDGSSFVLSATDLTVQSGFCQEFVKITITRPPTYGLLTVDDPAHHTRRHLTENSTFLLQDINSAFVSFYLYPDVTLIEDTTDVFLFEVEDPSMIYESPLTKREAGHTLNTFSQLIFIVPEKGSGDLLEFNLTTVTPKPITKIDENHYGATLGPEDMYLTNSDFLPSEVHIRIHQQPEYGYLEKENVPIEQLTLADVYSRKISYLSTITHTNTSIRTDEFRFSISVNIYNSLRRIELDRVFNFSWCYFSIDLGNGNQSFLYISEPEAKADITLRQIGYNPTFLQTAVSISTVSDNHTLGGNCSRNSLDQLIAEGVDYCSIDEAVVFSQQKTKHKVKVKVVDDSVPEGQEEIRVHLSEPEGCLIPKVPDELIYIYDQEDYSYISFLPSNEQTSDYHCHSSANVPEDAGTVNVTLVRTQNVNTKVGVVCYTEEVDRNKSNDYVHRPNNDSSIVYFYPGESQTVCPITIIDDQENEPLEHFFLHLGRVEGYGYLKHTRFCVYIEHDIADVPVVFFPSSETTIQESYHHPVTVFFKVQRVGFDLQKDTGLECLILSDGNATKGTDFEIKGLEAITIPAGATETMVYITVFNDTHLEGPEDVYIQMTAPYQNGRLGKTRQMKIIILDSKKDSTVGFSNETVVFYETDSFVMVPLHRHGDLNFETKVFCEITPITATKDSDFLMPLKPETVKFRVNQTTGACTFFILDDNVREKEDLLRITITTDDLSVRIFPATTEVSIVDPEDAPHISFTHPSYTVQEPLSNNPIDRTTITLTVTKAGNTSINTTLFYHTANGTARAGKGYIPSEGELNLGSTDDTVKISITVLADHQRPTNAFFYVILFMGNHGDDVVLAPHNVTRVTIKNRVVGGVFFPSPPLVLGMLQNGITDESLLNGATVNSDQPLVCVTPCDNEHKSHILHSSACIEQDIDPQLTLYHWELSLDGSRYSPLSLDTLVTSTHSRVLQPVYFKEGVWLRCRATAVDSTGLSGYSRTSAPVLINGTVVHCTNESVHEELLRADLTAYVGYRGRNEDLLHLDVTLPNIANTFPVVTTSPPTHLMLSLLTHPPTRTHYPCSTVSHDHEFLFSSRVSSKKYHESLSDLFYTHLDAQRCEWRFSLWLPVGFLLKQCSAQMSEDRLSAKLSLSINYIHIASNTSIQSRLQLEKMVSFTARNISKVVDQNVPPFELRPNTVSEMKTAPPYLQPLIISKAQDKVLLVLRSHSSGHGMFIRGTPIISGIPIDNSNNNINNRFRYIFPIKASTVFKSTNETLQTWLIEVFNASEVDSFDLLLVMAACPLYQYHTSTFNREEKCLTEPKMFSFSMTLSQVSGVFRMGMRLLGYSKQLNETDPLYSSFTMSGSRCVIGTYISLDPSLVLTSNNSQLSITAVTLCGSFSNSGLEDTRCSEADTEHHIMGANSGQEYRFNVSEISLTSISFHVDLSHIMEQESSIKRWYFHVNCSLQSSGMQYITQDILIPIPNPQSISSASLLATPSDDATLTQDTMPAYATVLISIMLGAFTITCSITGLVFCYSVKKRYKIKKFELEMAAKRVVAEAERERERTIRHQTTKSYKKKHVGRHYPHTKSSFQLLMRPGSDIHSPSTTRDEIEINVSSEADRLEGRRLECPEIDEASTVSSESLKQSSKSFSLPTLFFSSTSSPSVKNNEPLSADLANNTPPISSKRGGERGSETPVATVRPISVRPLQPTRTLSISPFTRKTDLSLKPFLETVNNKNNGDNTIKPVTNPDWYERHLAREKAMAAYSQIYLPATVAELPKPSETETLLSNEP